jgi:YtxH-like protein
MSKKFWLSLGTAIAASRAAQTVSHVKYDDVLGLVGLARRRNTTLENVALIGLGAIVGAGAALLLAPTDGQETRRRVADSLGKARAAGLELVNEAKERAPELVEYAKKKSRELDDHATANHHA